MVGRVLSGAVSWFNQAIEDLISYLLRVKEQQEAPVDPEVVAEGKKKVERMRSTRVVRAAIWNVSAGPGYGSSTELEMLEDNKDHGIERDERIQVFVQDKCRGRDLLDAEGEPMKFTVLRFLSIRDQQRIESGLEPETKVIEIVAVHRL